MISSSLFSMTFEKHSRGAYEDWNDITALSDGKEVGQISYTTPKECSKNSSRCRAFIVSMNVQPAYRRRGIGRQLMQEALHDMRKKKCTVAEVEVADETSVPFYKKLGFIIDNREVPWFLQWIPMSMIPMKYRFNKAKIQEKARKRENRRIEQFAKFRETLS